MIHQFAYFLDNKMNAVEFFLLLNLFLSLGTLAMSLVTWRRTTEENDHHGGKVAKYSMLFGDGIRRLLLLFVAPFAVVQP